jgi:hypothetical protein
MRKKQLSALMSAVMAASLLAGCSGSSSEETKAPSKESSSAADKSTEASTDATKEAETEAETKEKETDAPKADIPQDYKYYFAFDEEDDRVHLAAQRTGETPIVQVTDDKPVYVDGVKGKALYLDGSKGAKLDVNGVGDTYTVSFWVQPLRSAQYMPTLQYGPDIHGDSTGGQHYVNFTWAKWNPDDTTVLEYPCVWAYDQLDNAKWPNFYPGTLEDLVKKWTNITMTVDADEVTADGSLIIAHLYVNGEEFLPGNSEGEERNVNVVFNTMQESDNFDFLLGINYWDAIFKGAFDEIYVYDYVLSADQIKGLYSNGDPSAKFDVPERIIEVVPAEDAYASIGATDFSKDEDVYEEVFTLPEGEDISVKLKHFSNGEAAENNYYFIFTDKDGNEIARVNADATGKVNGDAIPESAFSWTWGNWNTWERECMRDTSVKAVINYTDGKLSLSMDNVDYNGTDNIATVEFEAADIAGFKIGNIKSYTDIISIASAANDPNIYYFYGVDGSSLKVDAEVVGAEDGTSGFWTEFSKIYAVPAGGSKTVDITMKHVGTENYQNVFAVLQNVGGVHKVEDNESYKEYAVVRADNFGWGDSYDAATKECDWNWDTMAAAMKDAKVSITVTNNTDSADVEMLIKAVDGTEYHQSYKNIAIDGKLFFCLGVDGSSFEVEGYQIGAEDGTSGFWTEFSDVYAVAPGTSVKSEFTVTKAGADNWNNVFMALTNAGYGTAATADYPDYAEYAVFRADNWGWGDSYGTHNADTNFNFDEMAGVMQDAHVVLEVTNNGDTADVKFDITAADGQTYYMYYTGINVAH